MVLLFIALFNSILGLSVLFPVLAPLGRQLGLSELEVGTLSTAYALMQFLMARLWGRRSEASGRKPILLVGILGFSLSFFCFAAVAQLGLAGVLQHGPLYALLLASRLIGGAFSSATLPTGQAYAADVSERKDRTSAMGVIGAAFGLGIIFGPAIGAGVASLADDLLAPVYFSASVALVNALFVWLRLPEPERKQSVGPRRSQMTLARKVWPLLAVGLAATLASVAMEQTVAFYYADRLGLPDGPETARAVGVALVGYGMVAVVMQGFVIRRFKIPARALMASGIPIALAGFVLFIFARSYLTLTAALLVQGLGQGLVLPGVTAATSLAVTEDEQGSVAGLNGSAQGLGRTLGPLVGTGLYDHVAWEAPYVFSAGLLATLLLVVGWRSRGATPDPEPHPHPEAEGEGEAEPDAGAGDAQPADEAEGT